MKPMGWPPARSGTILRLGEKRARSGYIAYASESDFQNSSFVIRHFLYLIRIKRFHPGFYQFIRPIFKPL